MDFQDKARETGEKIVKIVIEDLMDAAIDEALDRVVKATDNTVDDAFVAGIKPYLKAQLKEIALEYADKIA